MTQSFNLPQIKIHNQMFIVLRSRNYSKKVKETKLSFSFIYELT